MKEVELGCMLGPFDEQPLDPLICSPVGMVEKKNSDAMYRITHLSHPQGKSINSFIAPEDAETHYQTFELAVQLVAKHGKGSFMAKEDFKSAFHNVPMQFQDLNLLGIKVQGKLFINCALPFGASISCAIFEDVSTLIYWIAEKRACQKFIHYLDDLFMVHYISQVCSNTMQVLKDVSQEIKMPIVPEKSEGSSTIVEFLGLTLDTELMVVHIPAEKLQDIKTIIGKMLKSRKATSWELQSIAGKLNFVTKAVPAGKCFIKRIYEAQAGVPQHHHVDLRSPGLSDLRMWKVFTEQFQSWTPIVDKDVLHQNAVEQYAYASSNASLGGGSLAPPPWLVDVWGLGTRFLQKA